VTAAQVRDVVTRIVAAGHWRGSDPDILVIFDAGYDLTRLAWLLRDLPVEVLGRLRSDRVMYFPPAPAARHQRPAAAARRRAQARR
jgi:predicted nucleotidyltransferase